MRKNRKSPHGNYSFVFSSQFPLIRISLLLSLSLPLSPSPSPSCSLFLPLTTPLHRHTRAHANQHTHSAAVSWTSLKSISFKDVKSCPQPWERITTVPLFSGSCLFKRCANVGLQPATHLPSIVCYHCAETSFFNVMYLKIHDVHASSDTYSVMLCYLYRGRSFLIVTLHAFVIFII